MCGQDERGRGSLRVVGDPFTDFTEPIAFSSTCVLLGCLKSNMPVMLQARWMAAPAEVRAVMVLRQGWLAAWAFRCSRG